MMVTIDFFAIISAAIAVIAIVSYLLVCLATIPTSRSK